MGICKAKPLFLGSESDSLLREEGGLAFQEELSEQEGLRNYECARWRLQWDGIKESSVPWYDLWKAIKDQPDVVTSLIPAPPLIRWALDPIAVQIQGSLPRATTPLRSQKQLADLLTSHPYIEQGDAEFKGSKRGARSGTKTESRPASRDEFGLGATSQRTRGTTWGGNLEMSRPTSRDEFGFGATSQRTRGTTWGGNLEMSRQTSRDEFGPGASPHHSDMSRPMSRDEFGPGPSLHRTRGGGNLDMSRPTSRDEFGSGPTPQRTRGTTWGGNLEMSRPTSRVSDECGLGATAQRTRGT